MKGAEKDNKHRQAAGGNIERTLPQPRKPCGFTAQKIVEFRNEHGRFKSREFIVEGIENAGLAMIDMLEGRNFGKTVVRVAEDPAL